MTVGGTSITKPTAGGALGAQSFAAVTRVGNASNDYGEVNILFALRKELPLVNSLVTRQRREMQVVDECNEMQYEYNPFAYFGQKCYC
jgi:hypothetical protein